MKLASVELCEGLKQIGDEAFSCTLVRYITIPSTLVDFGSGAFGSCNKLAKIELCEGLKLIGESAFSRCTSLRRI